MKTGPATPRDAGGRLNARYLGRSIATIRRIEGRHLYSHRDARGVFQFDQKVRELREALKRGELRHSLVPRDHPGDASGICETVLVCGATMFFELTGPWGATLERRARYDVEARLLRVRKC